ncbi:MAG: DUF1553 domain-containing protein [Planctomycetes bacterium]|nr:DUF1553 domain-containing protein [Planctomycetota bacterium]
MAPRRNIHARAAIAAPALWLSAVGLSTLVCGTLAIRSTTLIHTTTLTTTATTNSNTATNTQHSIRYGRDIRPILSDRCFQCHGQDPATRQENLRLDQREEATASRPGGAAIVPGDAQASQLYRHITTTDPKSIMPPPGSNKRPLSDAEKNLIRDWINQGAPYEPHWSFTPPTRPAVPTVQETSWPNNAIDNFILARLSTSNITPSPDASDRELLRRLFLDVTGLPPTPVELSDYLADTRPDRYERWVHKLLNTEPYVTRMAERLATPWLDMARYADTAGIHMDAGRQIWPYRDWVLAALLDNMPFDQFTVEQIAGDLLPSASEAQKVATGFNRCHVTSDEGGAINEEYLVEYAVDRVSTTSSVFLGLTVGCARCHDHKYDPISAQDFYSLYSYFNSVEEPGIYDQRPDANRAFEPFMMLPSAEDRKLLDELKARKETLTAKLSSPMPEDDATRQKFFADAQAALGLTWHIAKPTAAMSVNGATLTIQPDDSILAGGANPANDDHLLTLRTDDTNISALLIEAMGDPSLAKGRAGRTGHGNAVLTGLTVEVVSVRDPAQTKVVNFRWAWANVQQPHTHLAVTNLLDDSDLTGWGLGAHEAKSAADVPRTAVLLADEPFGYEGGTELHIALQYRSEHAQHVIGRVRIQTSRLNAAAAGVLPVAIGGWYVATPFGLSSDKNFETAFGPEKTPFDMHATFGPSRIGWKPRENSNDGEPTNITDVVCATYLAREIYSPDNRELQVSLGSDDAMRLFANGKEVISRKIDRGVMPDQDRAVIPLKRGRNTIVYKIINTGGPGAYYFKPLPPSSELGSLGMLALLPDGARTPEQLAAANEQWLRQNSPRYRQIQDDIAAASKSETELNARIPRTMIMKELEKPRETFVLTRGQYDHPDKSRPVTRNIPAALGTLPADAPADRRGLATWLTSPQNPLLSRVTVNRYWELFFGSGIVRTTEDFGLQGEWPSHPELLDWLAVEFRESGWNTRHILELILTSRTYRQSSHTRPELRDIDSENRLLASFPRRRLTAEQLRDQALYLSGLLKEKLGGPSVKPYQPDGLWQEVAMPQSNTRTYQRGMGDELYRRSLYTYWKRAAPPPSMLTFDAPTREFCSIRRPSTSTPLQALVLWNDEQFVEAARVLAQRTLTEGDISGDIAKRDTQRLYTLFERCTSQQPDEKQLAALVAALADFRTRFMSEPAAATDLLNVGLGPIPDALKDDPAELASWTMIASSLMNLYQATTQH